MGYVVGAITEKHHGLGFDALAIAAACVVKVAGYYIAEAILFGTKTAFLMSLSGSLIQSGGSAIVFIILGIFLDKMGFKKRFLK